MTPTWRCRGLSTTRSCPNEICKRRACAISFRIDSQRIEADSPRAGMVRVMAGVVIYATGSPIVVDIEESLFRANIPVRAGVQNRPGASFLTDPGLVVALDGLIAELTRYPFVVP